MHAATLLDGTDVIVKVQRPWAARQVETDLELLGRMTHVLIRHSAAARRVDLAGLAREFGDTLRTELDYELEAANCERFAANFSGDPCVAIPLVCTATPPRSGC